jgi:branched-chain amino acid transport system permease protein
LDIKINRFLIVALLVGLLIAVILPLWLKAGWVSLLTEILILSVAACAYNLMMGYGGMVSFGPAGQYALGAYVTGILLVRAGAPFALAMLAGPFVAALLSIVIGWFSVRRTEVYFSLLTLAFAQIIYTIIQKWYGFTGGDDGLVGIPVPRCLTGIGSFYYFALAVTVGCFFAMWKIVNSPFGQAVQGIRENPRRAAFIGINVRRYQLILFVISSFFIGVSGSLYAVFNKSIFPANIDVLKSTDIIVVTLLGGMYNFLGPLLGSAVYLLLNKLIANYTHYWALFLGMIIVLLVLYARHGIAGFVPEHLFAFNKNRKNT